MYIINLTSLIKTMNDIEWNNDTDKKTTIWKSIFNQRKTIKNYPWVSQALWLIPILWAIKNLWETLVGQDSITSREFTTKEQIFKAISGLCALSSWWIVWYNSYYGKELFETIVIVSGLQIINRTSYITGVYYSWELQKTLQQHKDNMSKSTQNIISTTKKITANTKKIVQENFSKNNKK